MPTVGLVSLGCSKNRVDSEQILGAMVKRGFTAVSDPALSDVIIINTCGFIESAKEDSLDTVFEMAEHKLHGECSMLVVCGCLTERYYDELREALPEADLIWGVRDHEGLAAEVASRLRYGVSSKPGATPLCGNRVLTTPKHRAYLRISDGCDNRCTYCAIPLIRGGRASVPMEALIYEATALSNSGVTEITVIAQDTSAYGIDIYAKPRIAELLTKLSHIDGIRRIRLLYTYPDTVDEALIDVMRSNKKICNYIDMPIQHINPSLLKSMNRRGSAEHIRHITDYIRSCAPDFVLRTTVIVGFPGETDEQFEELLSYLKQHPYDRLGAFAYSAEDGTIAAEMEGQVAEDVKRRRLNKLMLLQRDISLEFNKKRIGGITEVVVDRIDRNANIAYCRSYAEEAEVDGVITVKLPDTQPIAIGEYVNVRISGAGVYDLTAELV